MSKRDSYEKDLEEKIDLYNARVSALKAHVGEVTRTEDLKEIEVLAAASAAASALLTELKATSGDEWDGVKARLEKSRTGVEGALDALEASRRTRDDTARAQTAASA